MKFLLIEFTIVTALWSLVKFLCCNIHPCHMPIRIRPCHICPGHIHPVIYAAVICSPVIYMPCSAFSSLECNPFLIQAILNRQGMCYFQTALFELGVSNPNLPPEKLISPAQQLCIMRMHKVSFIPLFSTVCMQ